MILLAGARSALLFKQAYTEEGLPCPEVNERKTPVCLLFPRSFVDQVNVMPGDKRFDYSFMGSLYRPEIFPNREWILDFARRRFSDRSFLLLSQPPPNYQRLGPFDHTGRRDGVWVPKDVPPTERDFFHAAYFQVLRQTEFALCPAGDAPWSQRFFEAIMCRAIPVVSDREHSGRNELERSIGYRSFLRAEDHVYDPEVAEHNYELFVRHQTLTAGGPSMPRHWLE